MEGRTRENMSGQGATPRRRFYHNRWFRRVVLVLVAAGLLVGGYRGYFAGRRAVVQAAERRLDNAELVIKCGNPPPWLAPEIIRAIEVDEAQRFAEETAPVRPDEHGEPRPAIANYFRLLNPYKDAEVARPRADVLREFAEHFEQHQAERYNAWIRRVTSVERLPLREEQRAHGKVVVQVIRFQAEFRKPLGFIAQGDKYYLAEKVADYKLTVKTDAAGKPVLTPDGYPVEQTTGSAVRLPGEYSEADRRLMTGMLMVRGVDEPLPEPGKTWTTQGALEGLRLVETLGGVPYREQIAAINVENIGGKRSRNDPAHVLDPEITLDTAFGTAVWWGRPVRAERFYEVSTETKLKALQLLFARFNRIDAGRQYVDIRLDQPRVPKPVTPASTGMVDSPETPPSRHHG